MFLKNLLSSDGDEDVEGVGEGLAEGVCARTEIAAEKMMPERIMPRRPCDILLLLMFLLLVRAAIMTGCV
jgi:hypothetical protein